MRHLLTLFLTVLALSADTLPACAQQSDYETIRFFTPRSKQEKIARHALSPDGQLLALAFMDQAGTTRHGVTIVDLNRMELAGKFGKGFPITLAFADDSQRILTTAPYQGIQQLNLPARSIRNIPNSAKLKGKIGINLEERNGKLVITSVNRTFNPTLPETLKTGLELVAFNQGAKPELWNDLREWEDLVGKPKDKAIEIIGGPPGTWLQLRFLRRGSSKPLDFTIQRQWANWRQSDFPAHRFGYGHTLNTSRMVKLRSANTGMLTAFVNTREIAANGPSAISDDGKLFASVATANSGGFIFEIVDLVDGKTVVAERFEHSSYRSIRFIPNSKRLVIGTRDTLEIYDVNKREWEVPVTLTPPELQENGRAVNRYVPLGFGLPGDLYTSYQEVVYEKPGAVAFFDISPNGIVAIASEDGEVVFASLETRKLVGVIGEKILGGKPEFVEFNATGSHLVSFANGMLHIFKLNEGKNSLLTGPVAKEMP